MNKLRRILKNPLITVLPLVIGLLFIWQQHTTALTPFSAPSSNLLANGDFETWNNQGAPDDWLITSAGNSAHISRRTGYNSPSLLAVTNTTDTVRAGVEVVSPSTTVHSATQYFYKGYYTSSVPFDLIFKVTYKDGSTRQSIIGHYNPSVEWTTATHLFTADSESKSVQFIYRWATKGELQLDHCYLESDPHNVYQTSISAPTNNLLGNPALTSSDSDLPDGWSSYTTGDQKTNFGYVADKNTPYLHAQVTNYKSGEAKWQYEPVSVTADHLMQFNVTYRSDTSAHVVAEYVLNSGERKFQTIADLLPTKDWTDYTGTFEVPSGARNVVTTAIQRTDGTLDTKSYALYDITKPGEVSWKQPVVSYTFDDGWESIYTNAISPLSQAGYKATFYLNPSSIDTPHFLSSNEVAQLQAKGYELASHGYEHLDFTTLSPDAANQQLEKSYQYFNQVHNQKTVNLATPYGTSNPQIEYIARKYYASLRGATSGINTRQNFNPYNLSVMYVGRSTPIEKLADTIAETKARHGWLILVYHRVDTDTTGETTTSPMQFQQQLNLIKQSGLHVKTVQAALQEISQQ